MTDDLKELKRRQKERLNQVTPNTPFNFPAKGAKIVHARPREDLSSVGSGSCDDLMVMMRCSMQRQFMEQEERAERAKEREEREKERAKEREQQERADMLFRQEQQRSQTNMMMMMAMAMGGGAARFAAQSLSDPNILNVQGVGQNSGGNTVNLTTPPPADNIGDTGTKSVSPKTPMNIMPGEFDREKDSPKKAEE